MRTTSKGPAAVRVAAALVAALLPAAAAAAAASATPPTDSELQCGPGGGDCFTAHGGLGCEWGPCCEVVCAIMPECCTSEWDELCAEMAAELCERPPACRVAVGDCLDASKDGGCRDRDCCELVCAIDPFCCTSRWDSLCVAAAAETCGVPACVIVTGDMLDEGESCGEPLNDGCDQPEQFAAGTIGIGQELAGRTYAIGRRDVDWYAIDGRDGARLTVRSAFPAEVSIVIGDCEAGFTAITAINVRPCDSGSIDLPPGLVAAWVVITPGRGGMPIIRGIPCVDDPDPPVRTFGDRYTVSLQPLR